MDALRSPLHAPFSSDSVEMGAVAALSGEDDNPFDDLGRGLEEDDDEEEDDEMKPGQRTKQHWQRRGGGGGGGGGRCCSVEAAGGVFVGFVILLCVPAVLTRCCRGARRPVAC
jgi:hypothetical protein